MTEILNPLAVQAAASIMARLRTRLELHKILGPAKLEDGTPWISPDVQEIMEHDMAVTIDAAMNEVYDDCEKHTDRLHAIIDERWKDAADPRLLSAGPDEDSPDGRGGFVFRFKSPIIPLIVESMAASLKHLGAENYASLEMTHDEMGPLLLTVQRRRGKTPGAIAAEWKERAETAEAEIRALKEAGG